jgi:hypothetical protein
MKNGPLLSMKNGPLLSMKIGLPLSNLPTNIQNQENQTRKKRR